MGGERCRSRGQSSTRATTAAATFRSPIPTRPPTSASRACRRRQSQRAGGGTGGADRSFWSTAATLGGCGSRGIHSPMPAKASCGSSASSSLFVAWWLVRWWAVRRVERRAGSAAPTLVMLGAVMPPRAVRRSSLRVASLAVGRRTGCALDMSTSPADDGGAAYRLERLRGRGQGITSAARRRNRALAELRQPDVDGQSCALRWPQGAADFHRGSASSRRSLRPGRAPRDRRPARSSPFLWSRSPCRWHWSALAALVVGHNKAEADHIVAAGTPVLVTVIGRPDLGHARHRVRGGRPTPNGCGPGRVQRRLPLGERVSRAGGPRKRARRARRRSLRRSASAAVVRRALRARPLYVLHRARLWRQMHRLATAAGRGSTWDSPPAPGGARDFDGGSRDGCCVRFASPRRVDEARDGRSRALPPVVGRTGGR